MINVSQLKITISINITTTSLTKRIKKKKDISIYMTHEVKQMKNGVLLVRFKRLHDGPLNISSFTELQNKGAFGI